MGRASQPGTEREPCAILRSGKHLLALLNDVIDVSKIEAGKIEPLIEEFDIHEVVADAVDLVANDAQEKGLELKVEALHLKMNTDRRRLLQCVINLLTNAVKFTEKGACTSQCTCRKKRKRRRSSWKYR